jgi:hypothetical protein
VEGEVDSEDLQEDLEELEEVLMEVYQVEGSLLIGSTNQKTG